MQSRAKTTKKETAEGANSRKGNSKIILGFCVIKPGLVELVLPGGKRFWKGCKPNFVCPAKPPGRESFVLAASTRNPFRSAEPKRAVSGSPIWPCTRWGFPCLRAYAWSGGLLPRLFTLTANPESWTRARRRSVFCGTFRRNASQRHARVYSAR